MILSPLSSDGFIEEFPTRLQQGGLSYKVRVDLSPARPGVVSLDYLEVIDPVERGHRLAAGALRLLLQLSDESGIALEVIPHSFDGPLKDDDLASWYGRHGFRCAPTEDTPRLMRREPNQNT